MKFETNNDKKVTARRILVAAPGLSFALPDGGHAQVISQVVEISAPVRKAMASVPRKPAVVLKLSPRANRDLLAEVA